MARFLRNLFYRVSLGNPAYRFLFQPGPPDEVVVIDCETTGLNPRRDEMIAVAAIKVRGRRILTSDAFRVVIRADKTTHGGVDQGASSQSPGSCAGKADA